MMEFSHVPVLLDECLEGLAIDPAGAYLDGTAGGGGHSSEIAKRLTTGRLVSLDQDPDAVAAATERLKGLPATVVKTNFATPARRWKGWAYAASTEPCWTWEYPRTSWTTRPAGFPTGPTRRWICA